MKKWVDISPARDIIKFVDADKIESICYQDNCDADAQINIYFHQGNQCIYGSDKVKLMQRFNEIAEAIGLSHRLGEQKDSAISVFRQAEEEKKKKKITVAEI